MNTVVIHDLDPDDVNALRLACKRSKLREGLALREILRAGIKVAFRGNVPTKAKQRAAAAREEARLAREEARQAVLDADAAARKAREAEKAASDDA